MRNSLNIYINCVLNANTKSYIQIKKLFRLKLTIFQYLTNKQISRELLQKMFNCVHTIYSEYYIICTSVYTCIYLLVFWTQFAIVSSHYATRERRETVQLCSHLLVHYRDLHRNQRTKIIAMIVRVFNMYKLYMDWYIINALAWIFPCWYQWPEYWEIYYNNKSIQKMNRSMFLAFLSIFFLPLHYSWENKEVTNWTAVKPSKTTFIFSYCIGGIN